MASSSSPVQRPAAVLLPAGHRLAGAVDIAVNDLADDTWIRAHHGSAARLVDHVLEAGGLHPAIVAAGHGDEPIETQALIAAGQGVTVAHALNVLIDPGRIAVVPLVDARVPHRAIQAAIARGHRAPATLAALEALRRLRADPDLPSALDAGRAVRCADGLGLRRAALAEVDREHGHRADGEELGLPVLERAVPEVGRGDVLQPADGALLVVELLGVVGDAPGDRLAEPGRARRSCP